MKQSDAVIEGMVTNIEVKIKKKQSDKTSVKEVVEAAKEFINPDDLKNSAIYPPPEMMPKLEFLKDLGRKTRMFDELWTQVKSK